jgi:hypothetical protein
VLAEGMGMLLTLVAGLFLDAPMKVLPNLGSERIAEHQVPATSHTREPRETQLDIRIGNDLRPLPFQLNLANSAAPDSMTQMVESLYNALPEQHLRLISAYFGGPGYRTYRSRYEALIDFYEDLYVREILDEAARRWHEPDDSPLARSRECVGRDFPDLIALQIGVKHMDEHRGANDVAPSERAAAIERAARVARRLFENCDRIAGVSRPPLHDMADAGASEAARPEPIPQPAPSCMRTSNLVSLRGRVQFENRFGRPGFGENSARDQHRMIPILILDRPINICPGRVDEIDTAPISGVRRVQLIYELGSPRRERGRTAVTGELQRATNAFHHEPVTLVVYPSHVARPEPR